MQCPSCGQLVADIATVCPACQAPLVLRAQSFDPDAPQPMSIPPAPGVLPLPQPPPVAPPYYAGQPSSVQIPNHLMWAILSTLFCCPPTGIVAIVFAVQVDSYLSKQDYVAAKSASDKAKLWSIISLVSGIVINIGMAILVIALFVIGVTHIRPGGTLQPR